MGSQPESQMGRDAASSPPSASANCLAISIFFCSLMPRPTAHDDFRLRQVDRLLGFLEDFLRLVADDAVGDFNFHGFDRSRACAGFGLVPAKRAVLKRCEPWSVAGETHVGGQLALKHLPGKRPASRLLS